MQNCSLSRSLVKVDNCSDYIPVVGAVANLFNLFLRGAVMPFMGKEIVSSNYYFNHIEDKSLLRMALSISVVGILAIFYLDFQKNKATQKEEIELTVSKYSGRLDGASPATLDNKELIAGAIQYGNSDAFRQASERVRGLEDVANMVLSKDGLQLEHASDDIKDSKDSAQIAVSQNAAAFQFISKRLQEDENFVFELYQLNRDLRSAIQELTKSDTTGHFSQVLASLAQNIHEKLDCPDFSTYI